MRIIDRFDLYMKEKGLNDNKVTLALNLSIGVIGKSRMEKRDLSRKTVAKILEYYNDLDPIWLTTGEGEMLCEPRQTKVVMEENNKNNNINQSGVGNVINAGEGSQTINNGSTIDKLVDQICTNSVTIDKLVDQIAKSQEQIDRVLTMLEKEQATKEFFAKELKGKLEDRIRELKQ